MVGMSDRPMWAQRAISRMSELGITQTDLARAMGVTRSAIGHYLHGRRPISSQDAALLCKTIHCSMAWLFEGTDGNVERGPDVARMVPELDWVEAGRPEVVQEPSTYADAVAHHPSPYAGRPRMFALRVRGASMEPKFREGDLIYVDPDEISRHGSYVVVVLDDSNEATFKQLIIEGGRKYLRALNPNWPEPIIEIDGEARICGVAVFKGEPL